MTDLIEEVALGPGASGIDPHLHGGYLSAVAAATGQRAVEVRCAGTGWAVR
ncbi:MAG: hypothetical protein JWN31_1399, partial [Frankiales bacterium]|nr:hypothetical protein [Frankiales bacterium]